MKLIYTHDNKILVDNAKNLLAQEGIETLVKNEYLSSGVGELSAIATWPELWVVHDRDYDRAKDIIAKISQGRHQADWQCPVCKEMNDQSFEVCWNCQTQKP